MEEFEKIELRSDDVQEILGTPPRWIVRWGTTIIFFGVASLGIFSWFFKYADKIQAVISVTTVKPPVPVVARSTGYLAKLIVKEGDSVRRGDLLLALQNPARYEDVLGLESALTHLDSMQTVDAQSILSYQPQTNLSLGDLQPAYSNFVQSLKDYSFKRTENFGHQNIVQLMKEKANYKKLIENERDRDQTVVQRNWKLASDQFNQKKRVYEEPNSAISLNELQVASREVLRYEEEHKQLLTTIQQYQGNIIQIEKSILEVQQSTKEGNTSKLVALIENMNQLKSAIATWKVAYLLTAPIEGKISFYNNYLSEKQNIKDGDKVMAIVPLNSDSIWGSISLSLVSSGRVKIGQRVIIRFDSYPYQQYGIVEGRIQGKADLPKDDKTIAIRVVFPHGLVTNYHKDLHFDQQMQGGAEIVTEERRFISRVFDKVISPLKNK